MKTSTTLSIAAAALSGLVIGTAARAASAPVSDSQGQSSVKTATVVVDAGNKANKLDDTATGKHDCKGANACKGQGGCKSSDNGCKGKNSCKGKGGCKTNAAPAPAPKL